MLSNNVCNETDIGEHASIDEAVKLAISAELARIGYQQSQSSQDESAVNQIQALAKDYGDEFAPLVDALFNQGRSYLLLSGLDIRFPRRWILMMGFLFGYPIAHAKEGKLVMTVKPKPGSHKGETSYYTWNRFALHTELPYIKHPPDFIALLCVNNVKGGVTYVSSLDAALSTLTEAEIEALCKPQFLIPIPPHFGVTEVPELRPVLVSGPAGYELRIRIDGLHCDSEFAMECLKKLHRRLESAKLGVELQPGQLLVVNNKKAAHGRSAFSPTFDTGDRELKRIYGSRDTGKYGDSYNDNRRVSGF